MGSQVSRIEDLASARGCPARRSSLDGIISSWIDAPAPARGTLQDRFAPCWAARAHDADPLRGHNPLFLSVSPLVGLGRSLSQAYRWASASSRKRCQTISSTEV